MPPYQKDIEMKRNEKRDPEKYPVKFLSQGELCRIIGLSRRVLLRKLEPIQDEIGERNGRYYDPPQVEIIYRHLIDTKRSWEWE